VSDMKQMCRADFLEYIAMRDMDSELKRALKAHERVPVFIDNLAREFYKCPIKISRETIKSAVYDMTEVFIGALILKANEALLSDVARGQIKAQQQQDKELKEVLSAIIDGQEETVETSAKGEVTQSSSEVRL